jgi:hypothetical protein
MIVDAMFLPVAFDDRSRFARSVGFGLEDSFAANHMISGGYVCSQNLFPCSVFEKRRIFTVITWQGLRSRRIEYRIWE